MSGSITTPKKPAVTAKKPAKTTKKTAATTRTKSVAARKPVKKSPAKTTKKTIKKTAAPSAAASHAHTAPAAHHPVHDVKSVHVPAAPSVKPHAKPKIGETWMWVSFFLTFLFIYSVTENVVNARAGITGSPSSYAAIPALALAVIVWKANRTKSTYTGMVVVLAMISAGAFVWFFGVTSASSLLFR